MAAKSRQFPDEMDDSQDDIGMSDADLEALMGGVSAPSPGKTIDIDKLEPGDRLEGNVIDIRAGEVLLELDGKHHGLIEEDEFEEDEELPLLGTRIKASVIRYDGARDMVLLSVGKARKEVFWEDLRPGSLLEALVTGTNKGGLDLDIKGVRAFMPISQIDIKRIEDATPFVGKKFRVEVTQVDREDQNLVVSRRAVLEKQAVELKGNALARLSEGEILTGTIVKTNNHGAFVDLGGVEGLIHQSKLHTWSKETGQSAELAVGVEVEVEIQRVDAERERVSLDLRRGSVLDWSASAANYEVGEEFTGWVSGKTADGVHVAIEEGVEGLIPRACLLEMKNPPLKGDVIRTSISRIDPEKKIIELRPLE